MNDSIMMMMNYFSEMVDQRKTFRSYYSQGHSQRFSLSETSETATGGVLYTKVFLRISQISQENICDRVSFLIKLQARPTTSPAHLLSCEFEKILRTPFLSYTSGRLLSKLPTSRMEFELS